MLYIFQRYYTILKRTAESLAEIYHANVIIAFSCFRFFQEEVKPNYLKDTEPLYDSFLYSLCPGIYPFLAMHSLLVSIICCEILNGD